MKEVRTSLWNEDKQWLHGPPGSSAGKDLPAMQRPWFDSWVGKIPWITGYPLQFTWPFLVVQTVKNPPATWETWVLSLGREDPLEEGMATHSSILTRRIPWTEEPGGLQSMGSKRVRHDQATKHSTAHSDFIRIQNPPLINSGMDHHIS